MITNFKIFEKNKTFNIKGQNIIVDLSNNKITDIDYIRSFNLSYQELIFCDIWRHIPNSQRKYAIGNKYSFFEPYSSRIKTTAVESCIGQEILCIDDKAGPFGGKPSVKEGDLYLLHAYNRETERCKIKNNGRFINIGIERFCKTDINVDAIKYNL